MTPTVRSAAGSDIGRRRAVNQDSAYTSSRLLAVADGMGGHAHGEVASAVAINAVAEVDASLDGRRPARRRPAQHSRHGDGHRRAAAHRRRRLRPRTARDGHDAGRAAGRRHPRGRRAHRRLPCLPPARRRAPPAHPRPHAGPEPDRRGQAHRGRGGRTIRAARFSSARCRRAARPSPTCSPWRAASATGSSSARTG